MGRTAPACEALTMKPEDMQPSAKVLPFIPLRERVQEVIVRLQYDHPAWRPTIYADNLGNDVVVAVHAPSGVVLLAAGPHVAGAFIVEMAP